MDIVMINVWEHLDFAAEAAHFCQIHNVAEDAAVLYDETGAYADTVGLRGVPFNLVVDETGTVVAAGATTPLEVMETLTALLGGDDETDEQDGNKDGNKDGAAGAGHEHDNDDDHQHGDAGDSAMQESAAD